MGSKSKRRTKLNSFSGLFVPLLILLIFALPIFTTGKWINDVFTGSDDRKVYQIENFVQRPADKNINTIRPFEEPIITITFDDGWESIYSDAFPIMQRNGIRTTQYILGGEFDNPTYMSIDQVKTLQKHGHEIAGHTMSHPNLTQLDNEDLYFEVVKSKEILEKEFGEINDFASPLGAQDDDTIKLISQHYRSQRNTAGDPSIVGPEDVNTKSNFNIYNIVAYTVRSTTTHEELQNLIDYSIKNNSWLVLTYHQVDYSNEQYSVKPRVFESHMKLIWDSKIRNQTIGQVLDILVPKGVEF